MIRKSTMEDLDVIMYIYSKAKEYMDANGNPTQWKDGYPRRELIIGDIESETSFVIEEDGKVCAVFTFIIGDDPTYKDIRGAWQNNNPYGTVHRIASDGTCRGSLHKALEFCFGKIDCIRIDTHEANLTMQHLIKKEGFSYCGIIVADDGTDRLAYMLDKSGR